MIYGKTRFNISFLFFIGLIIFCHLDAKERNFNDLTIFVNNIEQIPKERSLREAYFKVLLSLNRDLFYAFGDYLRILYGDEVRNYGNQIRSDTEGVKQRFYELATLTANDGSFIIRRNQYTPEQLFQYMLLIEDLTAAFNELFE